MTRPGLAEMLGRVIALPSISSVCPEYDQPNQAVVAQLAEWFEALGFGVELQPIPAQPGKSNLIATLGQGPEGLVLSGHTDTVPCDPGRWHSDPFALVERGGRYYGLGTADMKSFFPLLLTALAQLDLRRLRHPLVVLATADEESSMHGARALPDLHRQLGRNAVIGEPTGLRPVRMHKGITMQALRIGGRSGHSSDPRLGNNALEGMYLVIGELLRWRQEIQQRFSDPGFAVATPTLNLGHIHGGDNPNRICGDCELHFDLRPLPGMDIAELLDELDQRVRAVLADRGLGYERVPLFEGLPAMETPADSPIVQAVESLTGHPAGAVAFGTEGPYLNAMGMETVILGPGDIEQAHQPDEYLALERIPPYIDLLQNLVRRFCF